MQPYFFPYIGYFQLIASADLFIVYDNIQYTKKGWINRNRILTAHGEAMISLPLKRDSDYLDVRDRELAGDFRRDKLLNQIRSAYRGAPHFVVTMELVERVVAHDTQSLFDFLHNSIVLTCRQLGIETPIEVSSHIPVDHSLKGQEKVLAICSAVGADAYVNAIGGRELYARNAFAEAGIELSFLQSRLQEYPQGGSPFAPWLSIIDVMMYNSLEAVRQMITTSYELV